MQRTCNSLAELAAPLPSSMGAIAADLALLAVPFAHASSLGTEQLHLAGVERCSSRGRLCAQLQPQAGAVLARDDAETIVLDFVQPRFAGWRVRRFGGKAWRDEAARQRHGLPERGAGRVKRATVAVQQSTTTPAVKAVQESKATQTAVRSSEAPAQAFGRHRSRSRVTSCSMMVARAQLMNQLIPFSLWSPTASDQRPTTRMRSTAWWKNTLSPSAQGAAIRRT
jgi:hypothetical protein